ncbi:ABC transporter ATP-binding protein [Mesorhizobium argentiipisi]|uniref:ABC transporter ATP-binding protein n=1 Tax=Mesorhizobium argentiipisi TaxID=3015175 RepID=A0ABU8KA53_9HYPH
MMASTVIDRSDDIITLKGVTKRYGNVTVLEPVNLGVRDGEFLTILGPSGSGKTTILRIVGGFTLPSAGSLLLDGRDIANELPFRRPFNTVFQDYALFPHMSVEKNVAYGLAVRGQPKELIKARVDEVLDVVNLSAKRARYPSALSGGERQRVALARAIVCQPRVILLDEPLAALDAGLRRSMQVFLKDIQRRIATTFVFITHDQEEAMAVSDRIVVMTHGRVEQIGTPQEIYNAPKTEFVAQFFGENNVIRAAVESTSDSGVRVKSALGSWVVPNGQRLPVGDNCGVVIRPESFQMTPASNSNGGNQRPTIAGELVKLLFAGAYWHALVQPLNAPESLLKVRVPGSRADAGFAQGDKVVVSWSNDVAHLVAMVG